MDRWAVISDVHGNSWALEAVLEDALGRGATGLLNLGDVVYGPLDPRGTLDILHLTNLPTVAVRGNGDRVVLEAVAPASSPSAAFTRSQLRPVDLEWLESLPPVARAGELFLCHGSPDDDCLPLLERIGPDGVAPRACAEVANVVSALGAGVVLCGHTHVPRRERVAPGVLVVNPGSVGLPAYADHAPWAHAMEAGTPHARYAMLERHADGWAADLLAVPYEVERAATAAERHGRPDWARWLRTGRAAA